MLRNRYRNRNDAIAGYGTVFSAGGLGEEEGARSVELIAIDILSVAAAVLACLLAIWIARARRVVRRFEILYDIAEVSDESRSVEDTLDAICDVIVPSFADFCMIDVIAEEGVTRAVARVDARGGPEVERRIAEREPSVPEGLGIRSAITLGLKARGRLMGTLTVGTAWSRRRYRVGDHRFAKVLAGRVALTLDNAGLFSDLQRSERERSEIAETLQRGLLPPPLPHIAGWSAAAMYRPAGAENEVGGDFYDVFRVAGGWMLAIGDVTGRGAWAASIAAQARYTLHTAAVLTGDPLVALATLNRALLARRDSALCSVAALTLSEDPLQPVRVAIAGHPSPLLVDGEAVDEVAEAGPVLGAFPDASWAIERLEMDPGQQLVVITDGITEASGPAGRFGEERLRSVLSGATSPTRAVQQLEEALHRFTDDVLDDDAAMLVIAPASL